MAIAAANRWFAPRERATYQRASAIATRPGHAPAVLPRRHTAPGRHSILTSPLALPAAIAATIHQDTTTHPSSATSFAQVTLASDGVFGGDTATQLAQQTPAFSGRAVAGYTATALIGIARSPSADAPGGCPWRERPGAAKAASMTPLTLYNSYTRSLETFQPLDPANVRVYSCGPTVYNYAHIGNLRAYVFTDTLSRVLTWKGYDLTHIINITDVGHLTSDADAGDDKMEAAAKASGRDIWAVAAHYTQAFKANLADLNIREPSRFPLATDHIDEMIAFGSAIEAKHCYRLSDGLYFDTTTVPDYGRLARAHDDQGESRIDPVAGKRHPQDFAIWRTSAPGENRQMEWDSPWGRGAPGWHLECSVMSQKYLGASFDIHTGGIDHREIHHPNEIAQNQAHCDCADTPDFTGAQLWMHNNFLVDRTGKMSKSGGGFLTLQTLVDRGFHPLSYRLMCLQAHYRSELEFSWENLAAAQTRLKRLVGLVERWRLQSNAKNWANQKPITDFSARFDDAVSQDLNTATALVILEELASARPSSVDLNHNDRYQLILRFDEVLGFRLATLTRADLRVRPIDASIDEAGIAARLDERREARAAKDFARSDAIRDELAAVGVEVMDGDSLGWDWRIEV